MCKYRNCDIEPPNKKNGTPYAYCSANCKSAEGVYRFRERLRVLIRNELGGQCKRCGWSDHPAGLVVHHVDPSKKEFSLETGSMKSIQKALEELKKCVLLCANCHSIVHYTRDPEWLV